MSTTALVTCPDCAGTGYGKDPVLASGGRRNDFVVCPRHSCRPDEPRACSHRLRAVLEGTFVWRGGWYWLDCRTPNVPWSRCPWCDGGLAPSAEVARRILHGVYGSELGDPDE